MGKRAVIDYCKSSNNKSISQSDLFSIDRTQILIHNPYPFLYNKPSYHTVYRIVRRGIKGDAYFFFGPSSERFCYIVITKSMDLCTFVLFDVNICNMILVRNINIFSTTRRNVISFSKSSNCMISYNKLSIIHLNYIPTILRKFVVILSFLILTDNTLGQTLSSFIIYNSISS